MNLSPNDLGPRIDRLIAAGDAMASLLDEHSTLVRERPEVQAWDAACDDLAGPSRDADIWPVTRRLGRALHDLVQERRNA